MQISDQLVPTIEVTDILVTEFQHTAGAVRVYREGDNLYHVLVGGLAKHPPCSAEEVIRVLSGYLQAAMPKVGSEVTELRRMKTPADNGPISGIALAARMMQICGCQGQHDCDCVTVRNQASQELWTEHNRRCMTNGS